MLNIKTKTGSATSPSPDNGPIIIPHLCNDRGGWGSGFVLAVNAVSKAPEMAYRAWAKEGLLQRGNTQCVEGKPGIIFANMVAQDGYAKDHADGVAVDYEALKKCLSITIMRAIRMHADLHFPSGIGSGLAGGDKEKILGIIRGIAEQLDEHMPESRGHTLNVTFWEYVDTTSASYISTKKSPAPDNVGPAIFSDELEKLG